MRGRRRLEGRGVHAHCSDRRSDDACSARSPDPAALRAELNARIESARGPIGPLSKFQMEEMIDPRDTRAMICEWVELAYRQVSRPSGLVPRPLQFRP